MPHRRKKPQESSARSRGNTGKDKEPGSKRTEPVHPVPERPIDLDSRSTLVMGLIPVLAALAALLNSLANGFAYDDVQQILNNQLIRSIGNLPTMFTTSVWAFINNQTIGANDFYYRPIFGSYLTLGYALSGTTAWGWHLANVAIHALVTFFVYLVVREISARTWLAVVSATLFAVHPVHAESVAWISGAPDPLMALFVLPALYFYIRYRKTSRRLNLLLSVLLYFPAVFSKETALVFPIIVLSWELILSEDRVRLRGRLGAAAGRLAVYCLPIATYLAMRLHVLGRLMPPTARLSFSDGLRLIPKALAKYLWLAVFPGGYSVQHPTTPVESLAAPDFIFPLLIIIAVSVLIILTRSRLLYFAAVWFVVWLAPTLAALRMFFSVHAVLERYLYVPSIGICIAAALAIDWVADRRRLIRYNPIPEFGVACLLVAALLPICMQQSAVWKNNLTLYGHAIEVNPTSPLAHTALSTEYALLGRHDDAQREARIANELDPHCMDAYINLSYLAMQRGDGKTAVRYLEAAKSQIREGPLKHGELATICANLAELYQQLNETDLAEQNFMEATQLLPDSNKTWEQWGEFNYAQGRYASALEIFRKASRGLSRGYATIHLELGRTYERLNDPANARTEYEQYLRLAPLADDAEEVRRRLGKL